MLKGSKLEGTLKEAKLEGIWLANSELIGKDRLPGIKAEDDNDEVKGANELGHDKNDALDAGKEIAKAVDDNTGANDTFEDEKIPDNPSNGGVIIDDNGGNELKDKANVGII